MAKLLQASRNQREGIYAGRFRRQKRNARIDPKLDESWDRKPNSTIARCLVRNRRSWELFTEFLNSRLTLGEYHDT